MYRFLFLFLPFLSIEQTTQSLLWEISGNGLEKTSYLFGTIHRNDKELFQFSDSVYIALNTVDGIMTETDFFAAFDVYDSRYGTVEFSFDRNGTPFIKNNFISYTRFGNERGIPQFLDAYFQQFAVNAEKDFYALQRIEYLKKNEPNSNLFQLRKPIHRDDIYIKNYKNGNLEELETYIDRSYSENYSFEENQRNIEMIQRMDTILKSQRSVFCAVGASRLVGENNFIQQLTEMGYTLRRVESIYSENLKEKNQINSFSHHLVELDSLGFSAIFPGAPLLVYGKNEDYDFKMIYREYGQGNTYEIEFYTLDEDVSLNELAEEFIASPDQSKAYFVELNNGGEAMEGLSDAYPIGFYWTRVLLAEDYFVVLKTYGGNYFMASERAQHFFQQVELD